MSLKGKGAAMSQNDDSNKMSAERLGKLYMASPKADEDGQAKVHVKLVDVQVSRVEDHVQQVGVGAALIVGEVRGCPAITAEPTASLAPQVDQTCRSCAQTGRRCAQTGR